MLWIVQIIWIIVVGIAELITPSYLSLIIAIANFFIPDAVPVIDEVIGAVIAVKKLMD